MTAAFSSAFLSQPVFPGFDATHISAQPQHDTVSIAMSNFEGSLVDYTTAATFPNSLPASELPKPHSTSLFDNSLPASLRELLSSPFLNSDSDSTNDLESSPATQNSELPDIFGDFPGLSPFIHQQPISPGLDGSSKLPNNSANSFSDVAPGFPASLPPLRAGSCTVSPPFFFGPNLVPPSNVSPAATGFTASFMPNILPSPAGTSSVQSSHPSPSASSQIAPRQNAVSPSLQFNGSYSNTCMSAPAAPPNQPERPPRSRGSRHRCTQSAVGLKAKRFTESHCDGSKAGSSRDSSNSRTSHLGAFICPDCGRRFNRYYNLAAHSLIHDPNKPRPYICPSPSCRKAFARKYDARRHFAKLHVNPSDCPAESIDLIVDTRLTSHKER